MVAVRLTASPRWLTDDGPEHLAYWVHEGYRFTEYDGRYFGVARSTFSVQWQVQQFTSRLGGFPDGDPRGRYVYTDTLAEARAAIVSGEAWT